MEERLLTMFDKEFMVEKLNRLIKAVCINSLMVEQSLTDEMYVLYEIKEAIEDIKPKN
jgi:hypothetical protein